LALIFRSKSSKSSLFSVFFLMTSRFLSFDLNLDPELDSLVELPDPLGDRLSFWRLHLSRSATFFHRIVTDLGTSGGDVCFLSWSLFWFGDPSGELPLLWVGFHFSLFLDLPASFCRVYDLAVDSLSLLYGGTGTLLIHDFGWGIFTCFTFTSRSALSLIFFIPLNPFRVFGVRGFRVYSISISLISLFFVPIISSSNHFALLAYFCSSSFISRWYLS